MSDPKPTEIKLHRQSRILEVVFDDGQQFNLPCEYLRVYSPSAEVQGHGPGQEVLQTGKSEVNIESIKPIGHYAIGLSFSDGHDTGLYSWKTLYKLGKNQTQYWQDYLDRLEQEGASREP